MYRWYIHKMLRANPTYWTEYDQAIRKKGIVTLMKKSTLGKDQVHMTYTWFRAIIEKNNSKARGYVINGYKYNLGFGLGYLLARRIERNFSKPKVNVVATVLHRRSSLTKDTIYYLDDDYCRIAWHKVGDVRNESVYLFKPCKDFRLDFSRSLFNNPVLKYKYLFFPLRSTAQ